MSPPFAICCSKYAHLHPLGWPSLWAAAHHCPHGVLWKRWALLEGPCWASPFFSFSLLTLKHLYIFFLFILVVFSQDPFPIKALAAWLGTADRSGWRGEEKVSVEIKEQSKSHPHTTDHRPCMHTIRTAQWSPRHFYHLNIWYSRSIYLVSIRHGSNSTCIKQPNSHWRADPTQHRAAPGREDVD